VKATTLAFVGPRGAGKSTLGRLVAASLRLPFFDADEALAHAVGMGASDYLRSRGEPEFRRVEERVSSELLRRDGVVVALGGGALLSDALRTLVAEPRVLCVFVHAPVATLGDRIRGSDRPALTSLPLEREIEVVLAARRPAYEAAASISIDTSIGAVDELARTIVDFARGKFDVEATERR
jgi:shikimate kinase